MNKKGVMNGYYSELIESEKLEKFLFWPGPVTSQTPEVRQL
jgi:hypothetical protein